jgi:GTP-binding protein
MRIKTPRAREAVFVKSAPSPANFPPEGAPEIAFAGRSNVGKSSLINTLTGFAGLARTSSTPGRTQLLNWFRVVPPIGPELRFVDLPGYGYAKVSRELRQAWQPLVEDFVTKRAVVRLVIVILDIRRGAEQEELDLLEWLDSIDKPAQVVLTKADKVVKSKRFPAAAAARRALGLARDPIVFSAETGDGVADLWRVITTA